MENIQNSDSYFDYILREKKAAMRLADYKETGVWNEDSVYDDVNLTENEVNKFGNIFRSKFFPKKQNDFSSLSKNFVYGESYENEYNAIQNFVSQFNVNVNYDPFIDIANHAIIYNDYDNDEGEQTIDISQNVFFQDYLSQLTSNQYDIALIDIDDYRICLNPYEDSYCSGCIYPDNDYICEESCPE